MPPSLPLAGVRVVEFVHVEGEDELPARCVATGQECAERGRLRRVRRVDDLINRYGIKNIPPIMDKIKAFGFKYATYSGVTWGIDDVKIPEKKSEV